MKHPFIYIASCLAFLTVFSCKEPYVLPATAVRNSNYLVVEGNINVGQDSTIINLSRATPIVDTLINKTKYETGATVLVESDAGGSYPSQELGKGSYLTPSIPAGAASTKYRLNITTADGKQYLSDLVEYKTTPPIDSVNWVERADGVHIYTNAHDNLGKSKYYKWDYVETWEYHAPFLSEFVMRDSIIYPRNRDSFIYTCWHTVPSSNIALQTTTGLSSDIVYNKQLVFIPLSTERLGVRYSLLVKQTVLTEDGFNYWNGLSKITEKLGSLFDAQPSQLMGNIHCVSNPSEPVIGFINASNTTQQRIFIKRYDVHFWAYPPGPYSICDTVHVVNDFAWELLYRGQYLIVRYIDVMPPYYATSVECADCRYRGGVTTKPPFWP